MGGEGALCVMGGGGGIMGLGGDGFWGGGGPPPPGGGGGVARPGINTSKEERVMWDAKHRATRPRLVLASTKACNSTAEGL